ncbi:beta strand repeat-containing protein [Spongisporangium articulatum]|uniref:Beta strand repeat-containing protein n=1 Tax=Spongisporangium articulatum TaxID=3362603 RepID=A0ABW8AGM7_9ACTN
MSTRDSYRAGRARRRTGLMVVAVLTAALLSAVVARGQAQAAVSLGSLKISPETGQAISPITLTTVSSGASKGCPVGSGVVDGTITGPGGWAAGVPAISATAVGVSNTKDFTVNLSDTFSNIAAANSLTVLVGKYTISVRCTDDASDDHGTFSAPVWFTSTTNYQTTDPDAPAPIATTTTVAVAPAGSAQAGAEVTLTATVAPAAAAGTVQFKDGTANLGAAVAVSAGKATLKTTALGQGSHSLTGVFTPLSATYTGSASTAVSLSVTAAPATTTNTTLTASPTGSAEAGAKVTLTATIAPAAAAGTVQFVDGSTNIGSPVAVSSGVASVSTTTLAAGAHTLKATFTSADATKYTASTSADLAYSVTTAPQPPTVTSTTIAADPASPVQAGKPVTFTASVTPAAAGGSVQFTDTVGGTTTNLGSPAAVSAGTASLTTTALAAGGHSVKAVFTSSSPTAYAASTSPALAYTVTAAPNPPTSTSTGLAVTPAGGSSVGDPVALTASLTPATATGTVQFLDGSDTLGSAVVVTAGQAVLNSTSLAAGAHPLKAVFTPTDAAYATSTSSTVTYTVSPKAGPVVTTLTLSASPATSAPAGSSVAFTATVAPAAAGTVTFTRTPSGGTSSPIGSPVAVTGGQATVSISTLTAGAYSIGASFAPADATAYQASTAAPLAYTVTAPSTDPVRTTTTLTGAPAGPIAVGTKVALTATVAPAATGSVQFLDALSGTTAPLGTATVTGGKATLEATFAAAGAHSLTAVFSPADPKAYLGSTSAALAYQVNPATTPQAKPTAVKLSVVRVPILGNVAILVAEVQPYQAAGAVQFTDTRDGRTVPVGGPVKVYKGYALFWTAVSPGKHLGGAVFAPADPKAYQPSVSNGVAVDGGRG